VSMTFTFPGGSRVDARIGPFTVPTDQPPANSAPAPFALFLASIGACAAYFIQVFCERRGIPYGAIVVRQHNERGPGGHVEQVRLEVELPPDFPPRYREAVLRAAEQCTVKKHLERPPRIVVEAPALEPA
jgi:putative redox protein